MKYTKDKIPTKSELNENMDKFSFMPRISFAKEDSVQVCLCLWSCIIKSWVIYFIKQVKKNVVAEKIQIILA